MKTISKILSVVLCLTMVIGLFTIGASAADTYTKVTDGTLTSGEYVIVCANGVAMGTIGTGSSPWISTADPTISGDNVTDAKGAVWTLTVNGDKVSMTDANGKTIAPKGGNSNGIKAASYEWTYTFTDGMFSFFGNGSDTVALASNTDPQYANKFRAYKTTTIADAAKYPSTFTLYKKAAGSVTPSEPSVTPSEPSVTPSEPSVTPGTTLTATKASSIANGDKVIIFYPAENMAISAVANGKKLTGVAATVSGSTLTTSEAAVMDVVVDSNGYYSFLVDGKYLTSGATGNGLTLNDASSEYSLWTLETAEGGFYIKNVNAKYNNNAQYIEYYSGFTTYGFSASKAGIYTYQFFKVDTTSEPTEPSEPSVTPSEPSVTPSEPSVTPSEPAAPSTGLVVIDKPVVGTAYKFGMVQSNVSSTNVYYLKGGMDGYYMATTTDKAEAIDVYLEETTGGYYLYTMDGANKLYINMVVSGTHVNGAYEATASTVYRYDETAKTLIAVVNDTDYWFGTRNDKDYTTVGPCATSYNGFYCQFYGEPAGSSNTGDNSIVSVAVAVLVLSAIGGTALVLKKKEN